MKKEDKTNHTEGKTKQVAPNVLEVSVYNPEGKQVDTMTLPQALFGVEEHATLLAQAVRVYHMNQRLGTRSTQTRAFVTGSTRKIYRQKGTGRARHGARKAPIFIGGGVAHGPKPADFEKKLPKKMRRVALFAALSMRLAKGAIKIVKGFDLLPAKTKQLHQALYAIADEGGKKQSDATLLLVPHTNANILLAGRNIPYLSLQSPTLLHVYDVLAHKQILFTLEAMKQFLEFFTKPVVSEKETGMTKEPAKKSQMPTVPKRSTATQVKKIEVKKQTRVKKKEQKT